MSVFMWPTSKPAFIDFITRGYFHDRVIPPLNASSLGAVADQIETFVTKLIEEASSNKFRLKMKRSSVAQHSVPKRKHLRRMLSIPNPLAQAVLSSVMATGWDELEIACSSDITLTSPYPSTSRAVEALFDRNEEPDLRARRSVGCRYLLKTDIVRFYPSIYTHSLGWALHGKQAARDDPQNLLLGNRLDVCVRETQDKQTGGIPIGPDTSFVLGELIACAIDREIDQRLGLIELRGTRFIDDYHLYFESRGDAEKGIAAIHGAARAFELEINDAKTELIELPEKLEPVWKSHLRTFTIDETVTAPSIHAFFDAAAELAPQFPMDSIYTYVAKKLLDASLSIQIWAVCEPLLLRSVLAEPSMLPVILELFELHGVLNKNGLVHTLSAICLYHSELQHGYEVAWALWCFCKLELVVPEAAAEAVVLVDDDIVALVTLDALARGLFPSIDMPLWRSRMTISALYSEHWLLAYEALVKNWLPSLSGEDYVANEPFFSILRAANVHFYDPQTASGAAASIYG